MEKTQNLENAVESYNNISGLKKAWNFAKKAALPVIAGLSLLYAIETNANAKRDKTPMITPTPINYADFSAPATNAVAPLKVNKPFGEKKEEPPKIIAPVIGPTEVIAPKPVTAPVGVIIKEEPSKPAVYVISPEKRANEARKNEIYTRLGSKSGCIPEKDFIVCTKTDGVGALGVISLPNTINYDLSILSKNFDFNKYLNKNVLKSIPEGATRTIKPSSELGFVSVLKGIGAEYPTPETAIAILNTNRLELLFSGCEAGYNGKELEKFMCKTPKKPFTSSKGYVLLPFGGGEGKFQINPRKLSPDVLEALDAMKGGKKLKCDERELIGLNCKGKKPAKEQAIKPKQTEMAEAVTGTAGSGWTKAFWNAFTRNSEGELFFNYLNGFEDGKVTVYDETGMGYQAGYGGSQNKVGASGALKPRFTIIGGLVGGLHLDGAYNHSVGRKDDKLANETLEELTEIALRAGIGLGYRVNDKVLLELKGGYALLDNSIRTSDAGLNTKIDDSQHKGYFGAIELQLPLRSKVEADYTQTWGDRETTVSGEGIDPMVTKLDSKNKLVEVKAESLPIDLRKLGRIGASLGYEKGISKNKPKGGSDVEVDSDKLGAGIIYENGIFRLELGGKYVTKINPHDAAVQPGEAYELNGRVGLKFRK